MALIGKIRSNQKILVIFIGLAMVLFVVDPQTLFGGGARGEQPIGEIYGNQIMDSEWFYENRVENTSNNYRYQKQQAGQEPILTDQEAEQVRGQVWSQMIVDTLFSTELIKLGIGVSPSELNESLLYGNDPATSLKEQFSYGEGENKVFVRDSLVKNLNKFINNSNQETKKQLRNLEDQITQERIREKYMAMIKYGLTGTTEDANRNYIENGSTVSVKYAYKDFATVPDSVITVSEEELRAYYDKHQFEKKWKQEVEMRSFEYVTFDILPSKRDLIAAVNRLEKSKPGFELSENDSMFVQNNSFSATNFQNRAYDVYPTNPYEGDLFPAKYDRQILASGKGAVVGPFVDGKNVLMVKVRETGTREEAKARNIFFSTNGMDDQLKAKKRKTLDSLFRVVKLDTSKFGELASIYSDDVVSKYNNATHNWFPKGKIHANTKFESFCFEKPVGSFEIVETLNGIHIIQLLGRKMNEYQLIAVCDTKVTASKATADSINEFVASPVYYGIRKNGFEKTIEEAGLTASQANNIRIDYPQMGGIPKTMSILKWAFNSEVGATMEPDLIEGNTKLVVAYLTEVFHEGDPEFETSKELMKSEVIKEKKAGYIANLLNGASSIDDASVKLETTIAAADLTLSLNNFPSQPGNEPGVIGQVFALDQGVLSGPIVGENGVYVVIVENKNIAAKSEDISINKGEVTGSLRSQVDNRLIQALYNVAEAKDWRMKRTIINQ